LAGVGAKTIEKIEAAGISSVEKLAGMTPEQLMEIPGIGEKMVDKIYQAVNRFYEGGTEAAAARAKPLRAWKAPVEEGEAAAKLRRRRRQKIPRRLMRLRKLCRGGTVAEAEAEATPAGSEGDAGRPKRRSRR